MKFFTSDLHFGHNSIIDYCDRPFLNVEDMDSTLMRNWNNTVGCNDDVYIIGDFSFSGRNRIKYLLHNMNGRKHMILGNHDSTIKSSASLLERFDSVHEIKEGKIGGHEVTLCHYPMKEWRNSQKGSWLFHGHTHRDSHSRITGKNSIDVGVDAWDYKPVSFDEISSLLWRQSC